MNVIQLVIYIGVIGAAVWLLRRIPLIVWASLRSGVIDRNLDGRDLRPPSPWDDEELEDEPPLVHHNSNAGLVTRAEKPVRFWLIMSFRLALVMVMFALVGAAVFYIVMTGFFDIPV